MRQIAKFLIVVVPVFFFYFKVLHYFPIFFPSCSDLRGGRAASERDGLGRRILLTHRRTAAADHTGKHYWDGFSFSGFFLFRLTGKLHTLCIELAAIFTVSFLKISFIYFE